MVIDKRYDFCFKLILYDSLRGLTGKDVSDKTLFPNTDDAEVSDEYFNVQPGDLESPLMIMKLIKVGADLYL